MADVYAMAGADAEDGGEVDVGDRKRFGHAVRGVQLGHWAQRADTGED